MSSILLVGVGEAVSRGVRIVVMVVVFVLVITCSDNELVPGTVEDGCTDVTEMRY